VAGVAGVPLVLMARMQDESKVTGGVGPDQGGAVHHAGDVFEALREFDVISDGVDLWKCTQDRIGLQPGSKGVKRLGSKVSVWAMPPAIQRMMTVSAVGLIFSSVSASSWRGEPRRGPRALRRCGFQEITPEKLGLRTLIERTSNKLVGTPGA